MEQETAEKKSVKPTKRQPKDKAVKTIKTTKSGVSLGGKKKLMQQAFDTPLHESMVDPETQIPYTQEEGACLLPQSEAQAKKTVKKQRMKIPQEVKEDEVIVHTPMGLMRAPKSKTYTKMLQFMEHSGPIPFAFQTYDKWIDQGMAQVLRERPFFIKDDILVRYEFETWTEPRYKDQPLYPRQAILENINYVAQSYVTIHVSKDGKELFVKKGVPFFELEVMVNSSLCPLRRMSAEEKLAVGSDPMDPGGYYIVVPPIKTANHEPRQAKEVFHLNKDSMAINKYQVFLEKNAVPVSKITVSTNYGTQQVTVLSDPKTKILNVRLGLKDKKDVANVLTIFYIFDHMMNQEFDLDTTVQMILGMSKAKWRNRLSNAFAATIGNYKTIANPFKKIAEKMKVDNIAFFEEEVIKHINKIFFPTTENIQVRKKELALLVVRLLEFMIGERKLDDRDHWGNKRIDTSGMLIATLFNTLYTRVIRTVQETMSQRILDIGNIEKASLDAFGRHLTEEFHSAFTSNNWGPKNSHRANAQYVEPMPTNGTLITLYSLISGIKKPVNAQVDPIARQLKSSGWGYVGVDSPEGGTIGIKLFFSMLASVSLDHNPSLILDYIIGKVKRPELEIREEKEEGVFESKILFNGIFLGWGRGQIMEKVLRKMKQMGTIPRDTQIAYEGFEDTLYLDCKGGRPIRPVFVVENDQLIIDRENLWGGSIVDLLEAGAVEFLDPLEQKFFTFAFSVDFFHKRKRAHQDLKDKLELVKAGKLRKGMKSLENYKGYFDMSSEENVKRTIEHLEAAIAKDAYETNYHYSEIDPNAILGYTGGLVALAERNPIPRVVYQCLWEEEPVLMADGSKKKIKDVKIGDKIITVDPKTLKLSKTKVIHAYTRETDKKICRVSTMSGREIVVTEDHKFLTNKGWKEAREIDVDLNAVAIYHEKKREIIWERLVAIMPFKKVRIADITTESENHSFIGGNGFCVHNCNMGRQAVGRFSKVQHLLFNRSTMEIQPTGSFTQTGTEDFLGQSEHSPNQPVFMCVRPEPENQEDSIEINGDSSDRGMFHYTEYYSSKGTENGTSTMSKRIQRPEIAKLPENKRKFYRNVGEDGIAMINSIVDHGDVLISMIKENMATNERSYVPVIVRKGEGGVVDSVYVSTDASGSKTVSIKVRQSRKPIVGDKFQMGNAQKGTIGSIRRAEDLPFVIGGAPDMMGIKPDVIINTHAFPSRMTVGAFLEMMLNLLGIKTGTVMNVSSFQEELTVESIARAFTKLGIPNYGYVTLASGETGEVLEDIYSDEMGAQMFMLPISYRQLKHVVHAKIHARGSGMKKLVTGQPTGGRQNEGGPRFGRMEVDVFASHGVRANLYDRLCGSSSAFEFLVCQTCGNYSSLDIDLIEKSARCNMCENGGVLGRAVIPYISMNVMFQLMSANIFMNLVVEKHEERRIYDTAMYDQS